MAAPKRHVIKALARPAGLRIRIEEDHGGALRWSDVTVPWDIFPEDTLLVWSRYAAAQRAAVESEADAPLW